MRNERNEINVKERLFCILRFKVERRSVIDNNFVDKTGFLFPIILIGLNIFLNCRYTS